MTSFIFFPIGSVLEVKTTGMTWHFRDADQGHGQWQAKELLVSLHELMNRLPISVSTGSMTVEVRPTDVNKGKLVDLALRRARGKLIQPPFSFPLLIVSLSF